MASMPKMQLRHMGVYSFDPDRLAEFYSRWFGMVVSDSGTGTTGHRVVFMTGDPSEHHQIAFANMRERDWPGMNQISFLIDSLSELKRLTIAFHEAGVPILQQKDHGNTWSVYVSDPEGNRIEIYTPTAWYVQQPTWWPLDLVTESEETVRARTEASARAQPSFMSREAWMNQTRERIEAQCNTH